MDYTEGSLFTPLIVSLVTQGIRAAPVPFFLKPVTGSIAGKVDTSYTDPEMKNHLDFLEDYLKQSPSKGEFFCSSSITAADIMLHFGLEACIKRKALTETAYPTLYKYTRKLQGTASYKRAGEKVEKASGDKFVPFSET
jgi:glutathione S-transferase